MRKELELLIKLQEEIDYERKLKEEIESIPLEINQMNDELKRLEENLKHIEEKQKDILLERLKLEQELKLHESKKSKLQDQLMSVKDNIQYKSTLNEIAFCETEIDAVEEKILIAMEDEDRLGEEKKKISKELDANKTKMIKNQEKLEISKKEKEAELVVSQGSCKDLRKQIEPAVLEKFDLFISRRGGAGIARVGDDGICSGCRYKVRPQVFADLIANNDVQTCDNCARILYYIPPEEE